MTNTEIIDHYNKGVSIKKIAKWHARECKISETRAETYVRDTVYDSLPKRGDGKSP